MVTGATEAVEASIREQCASAAEGPVTSQARWGLEGCRESILPGRPGHPPVSGFLEAIPTPPQAAAILSPLISRCKLTIHSPLPEMSG